jgi:hypothetical protein
VPTPLPSTGEQRPSAESCLQMGEAAVVAASVAGHYRQDTADIAGTAVDMPARFLAAVANHCNREDTAVGTLARSLAAVANRCKEDSAETAASDLLAAVATAIPVAYHTDRYTS